MGRNFYKESIHSEVLCMIARGKGVPEMQPDKFNREKYYKSVENLKKKGLISHTNTSSNYKGSRTIYSVNNLKIIEDINDQMKNSFLHNQINKTPQELKKKKLYNLNLNVPWLTEFLQTTKNYDKGLKELYFDFIFYYGSKILTNML